VIEITNVIGKWNLKGLRFKILLPLIYPISLFGFAVIIYSDEQNGKKFKYVYEFLGFLNFISWMKMI